MLDNLQFDQKGLIPAIIQDYKTGQVLMMAYMNEEALKKTIETGKTWFYSRSRQKLWMKGEESGHIQEVKEISYDCDADTLLIKVEQTGVACHTGHYSCFYRDIEGREVEEKVFDEEVIYAPGKEGPAILFELYEIIKSRKENRPEGSYTAYLFNQGIDKILKKVGEETAEVIIAAKNPDKGETVYEIADLIYHLMVLMVEKEVELSDIFAELRKRR
ncbi:phosphoribosyl-ATP pyrophosphatase /phosphoribosyl-AMP cyclohydrolase [Thermosyntropha lipolytica DSM 11003]|uniref:Histidine biosynthesis bifunctional protein HisIE n=1 Tax=Thermosyntropha lipolytica DSM 11003 TaxID=1123382 RepID=A0A1M5J8J4_9FIRM|nr:bifunctional phosphoribosyl-AMP cyclohydrolase/phosphoribosyl-ATP diphosphatase HisIE [Thermosyntropha lipolytica]SHG36904.1 phosphoribosyl-ATP pyrophosphatase /phosphoribosyl-AMP cyclohydrolase [Thermosyntropha lipolytica DSM 11003]